MHKSKNQLTKHGGDYPHQELKIKNYIRIPKTIKTRKRKTLMIRFENKNRIMNTFHNSPIKMWKNV